MWRQRFPDVELRLEPVELEPAQVAHAAGQHNAVLTRLPVADAERKHAVRLYTEVTVVVLPIEHELTVMDECSLADLEPYVVLLPPDTGLEWDGDLPGRRSSVEPESAADAVSWCASSAGLVVMPMSLARLHHRKDLTYRPVVDAPVSTVALVWPRREAHPLCDELAGIVRGRSASSSRGGDGSRMPRPAERDGDRTRSASVSSSRTAKSGTRRAGGKNSVAGAGKSSHSGTKMRHGPQRKNRATRKRRGRNSR